MGVYNATVVTTAGQNLIASAIAGGDPVNFTALKTSTHVYPAGTALQNLTALSDVKQSVAPTSVDVYNNNIVQISARVPNTGIATAYLINTIGLFGNAGGGAETLIAVLTAQTPDEVPVFDAESPAAFIFNVQMTLQNADTVVFEVNDSGTATVADINRIAQPFTGATASAAGSVGRVPAPGAGDNGKFLRGDATWTAPADMVEAFTSSDVADGSATEWTSVSPLTDGEQHKSIFAKISQMFKNIRFLYANGIKNITRNGTTFTATRIDGTTFTFTQQDNDTWNANSVSVAGYVAAPTATNSRRFYATDSNGNPAWRNNIYFTGPSSTAAGLPGLVPALGSANYENRNFMYLRSDGGWHYLPLANNVTTTAEHYALDARQGPAITKAIKDQIAFKYGTGTITSISANSYTGIEIKNMGMSGYTLRGIVLINKTGTNADHVSITRYFTSDSANSCSLYFRNNLSSAVSNLTVTVLCMYTKD